MKIYLIANIITCIGALAGFIYGAVRFFRPRTAVYAQMITFAVGCMAFGRLYQMIRILTVGDFANRFHLGVLGVIGSLMFFFSANFGLMDGIADDGSKEFRKYRIIPLSVSVLTGVCYVLFFLFAGQPILVKIASLFISLLIVLASYYNLKHLIFPDVEYGVIRSLKAYNLLALIFELLCLMEMITVSREQAVGTLIIGILMGLILPAVIISVERGIRKWSI